LVQIEQLHREISSIVPDASNATRPQWHPPR
jgi:hypothetical protein